MKVNRRYLMIASVLLAAGLLWWGWSTDGAPTSGRQATSTPAVPRSPHGPIYINILASFDAFTPALIRAEVGQEVQVRILANGNHTFTIDAFKVDKQITDGETVVVRFIPDRSGRFTFYSRLPADRQRGLTGVLIVSPATP